MDPDTICLKGGFRGGRRRGTGNTGETGGAEVGKGAKREGPGGHAGKTRKPGAQKRGKRENGHGKNGKTGKRGEAGAPGPAWGPHWGAPAAGRPAGIPPAAMARAVSAEELEVLLRAGATDRAIAEAYGVDERTVRRWVQRAGLSRFDTLTPDEMDELFELLEFAGLISLNDGYVRALPPMPGADVRSARAAGGRVPGGVRGAPQGRATRSLEHGGGGPEGVHCGGRDRR